MANNQIFQYLRREGDFATVTYEQFEEWAKKDALSMTYSNLDQMDTVKDLDEIFFNVFSQIVMNYEEQEDAQQVNSQLLPNTERICISSTTAPTQATHADVDQLNTSKNINKTTMKEAPNILLLKTNETSKKR